jgi:hypothetical protein
VPFSSLEALQGWSNTVSFTREKTMAAIMCPRCQSGTISKPKSIKGGIIGPLIGHAMADRECPKCGVLALSDFPTEVQSQIKRSRVVFMAAIIVGFIVFVGGFVAIILAINPPN